MAKIAVRSAGTREALRILDSDELLVGRGQDCQIILADGYVSRQHCSLRKTPEGFRVFARRDSKSTSVNGCPVEESVLLQTGDIIRVGKTDILYVTEPGEFGEVPDSSACTPSATADDFEDSPAETDAADQADQVDDAEFFDTAIGDQPAFGPTPVVAISDVEADELRRNLPPPQPLPVSSGKKNVARSLAAAAASIDPEAVKQMRQAAQQRKKNDLYAKVIIFLIFGLPTIIVQAVIIWYFFLREE